MAKANRRQPLRVYLTPNEYRQVNQRADDQNQSISAYARALLLSPLAADLIGGHSQEEQWQTLVRQLGELYGLLDVLSSDLDLKYPGPSDENPGLHPSPLTPHLAVPTDERLQQLRTSLEATREEMNIPAAERTGYHFTTLARFAARPCSAVPFGHCNSDRRRAARYQTQDRAE